MADIFISYKKEDRHLAESIIQLLENEGFSVWYDERLNPSRSWDAMIESEIEKAKAVLVLWTNKSVKSEWVRNEADYGKENKKLIPLLLENCEVPLAFRRVQAANLVDWDRSASSREWIKACRWLKALIDQEYDTDAIPESANLERNGGLGRPNSQNYIAYSLIALIGLISILTISSLRNQPSPPSTDQRLIKAKTLFKSARFLTPNHIGVRGHIESNRSRLCIASTYESHEWENLLRGVNANKDFKSWSLGFDVEIFKDYLLSGQCLVIGYSVEKQTDIDRLRTIMNQVGEDPPYRLVKMSDIYEDWELGF